MRPLQGFRLTGGNVIYFGGKEDDRPKFEWNKDNIEVQRHKKTIFKGTEEQANLFQRNKETGTPPHFSLRRHRTTKVRTYTYYSKFTIVIQTMMFKQMLVQFKLFVLRSDASRFTANIVSLK